MAQAITDDICDRKTPDEVIIRQEARKPETDPTLGIGVDDKGSGNPPHRLVTIGDSITHGFQSAAIFNTHISYPAIVAKEMGWKSLRYPTYDAPGNGLPINLEWLARQIDREFGGKIDWLEYAPALLFIRECMDEVEDYWERETITNPRIQRGINHNLAVYGWDLRNTLSRTAKTCQDIIKDHPPKDDFLRQVVEYHNERAALRVLKSARDAQGNALTPLEAAAALGAEGTDGADGIETLIIFIGANNALGSILTFKVCWSGDDDYKEMDKNDKYTVWRPSHFKAELHEIVEKVKQIRARHVIWATVPHVTIAPFARGVNKDQAGKRVKPSSRYFPYYTLPWIKDEDFDPNKHPHITENEARAIESAIDQYNDDITEVVRQGRQQNKDWYLIDIAGLLDRLAYKRYLQDDAAKPSWWDEVGGKYELPLELKKLQPEPDSRFFRSDSTGRKEGGLFSLDGIHPTTIGYGIVAQEFINIMQKNAKVKFFNSDGTTERTGEIKVDFNRLIALDTLISNPPRSLANALDLIGMIDKNFNLFGSMLRSSY
jgi:hypothetical protein